MLANGPISWVSRRQPTVALSSTEAEYMALSDSSRHACWLRSFISELGYSLPPTPLCADNQGSIFLASNPAHDRRTKHIDIRYHFIREKVEDGVIKIYHVPSGAQLADALTKSLNHTKFIEFRDLYNLC